jgi:uncharacterized membrane-anchored protein YhcB (DUF1043 family)
VGLALAVLLREWGFQLTFREKTKMADEKYVEQSGTPGWLIPAVVLAAIAGLAGIGIGWTASSHADQFQQTLENELKSAKQDYTSQIAQLRTHEAQVDATNAELQSDLSVVTKKLNLTQGQLSNARKQEAADLQASQEKINDVNTTVTTQLATKANADDVKAVDTRVTGVRTDLDSTRSDLQMAKSQLGTLIATNSEQISELQRMGERDYTEFTINTKNKAQTVGSVQVTLKGTNPAKKQFSADLLVDDVQISRKNHAVNEPVFFEQTGSRTPCEFVVNKVTKDTITGYISVPKPPKPAATASASSD